MKYRPVIKRIFDCFAGAASIIGLGVSLMVSHTTREIVHKVEYFHETSIEHIPKTEINI